MLSAHCDWLVRRWIASTIHLRAKGEKQNVFPFRFDYRGANFIHKRGGCPKKYKHGNKLGLTVLNGKLFNLFKLKNLSDVTLCARKSIAALFPLFIVCICCSIVRNKPNFGSAIYSACMVYTKTIIQLSVAESGGYLNLLYRYWWNTRIFPFAS